jgi:histone H3/H4
MAQATRSDTPDLPTKDDGKDEEDSGKAGGASKELAKHGTVVADATKQASTPKKKLKLKAVGGKVAKPKAKPKPKKKVILKLKPKAGELDKPKRRLKPGVRALREIKFEQKTSHIKNQLAWAPFKRLVYEIGQNEKHDIRFKRAAVEALREEAQAHLIRLFSGTASMVCDVAKRTTIKSTDLQTANALMHRPDVYNAGIVRGHGSLAKAMMM